MPQNLYRAYEAILYSAMEQTEASATVLVLADGVMETPHILTQVGRLPTDAWSSLLTQRPAEVFVQPLASTKDTTALLAFHAPGRTVWSTLQQHTITGAAAAIEHLSGNGEQAEIDWHQITASHRILPVTEEELCRIVLDIHDGPVQKIYSALNHVTHLQHVIEKNLADEPKFASYQNNVSQISQLLEASLTEIRTFLGAFHPPEFKNRSLLDILEGLIIQHEALTEATVNFEVESDIPQTNLPTKIALYRILQEALSNGVQHAGVDEHFVYLWAHLDHIHLEVVDKGAGFTPPTLSGPSATERDEHIGLRGMRDRAQLVGGSFELFSQRGQGTRINVRVPCYG